MFMIVNPFSVEILNNLGWFMIIHNVNIYSFFSRYVITFLTLATHPYWAEGTGTLHRFTFLQIIMPSSCEILCFILACCFTPFSETPKYSHWSHLYWIVCNTDLPASLHVSNTSFGSVYVSLTIITVSVGFLEVYEAFLAASLLRRSCRRCCEGDFFLMLGEGLGPESGKWMLSGSPSLADRWSWIFPSLHDSSSFEDSPCLQCLANCQKLARATSRLIIMWFFFLKIKNLIQTWSWPASY